MGARPLDQRLVMVQHRIHLIDQGLDFGWVAPVQPPRPARAYRRKPALDAPEREQPERHLHHHRRQQADAQRAQRPGDDAVKLGDFGAHLGGIGGRHIAQHILAAGQQDVLFGNPEDLPVGAGYLVKMPGEGRVFRRR